MAHSEVVEKTIKENFKRKQWAERRRLLAGGICFVMVAIGVYGYAVYRSALSNDVLMIAGLVLASVATMAIIQMSNSAAIRDQADRNTIEDQLRFDNVAAYEDTLVPFLRELSKEYDEHAKLTTHVERLTAGVETFTERRVKLQRRFSENLTKMGFYDAVSKVVAEVMEREGLQANKGQVVKFTDRHIFDVGDTK